MAFQQTPRMTDPDRAGKFDRASTSNESSLLTDRVYVAGNIDTL